MTKDEALRLLGGSRAAAAEAIGCTVQAVQQWPDELPPRIADRVQAALWRKARPDAPPAPVPVPADAEPAAAQGA